MDVSKRTVQQARMIWRSQQHDIAARFRTQLDGPLREEHFQKLQGTYATKPDVAWTYWLTTFDDRLLYVGYTTDYVQRFRYYWSDPGKLRWVNHIRRAVLWEWPSVDVATLVEAADIHVLEPEQNQLHNSGLAHKGRFLGVAGCEMCVRAMFREAS